MFTKKSLVLRLISIFLCWVFGAEQLGAAPESLSIQGSPGAAILKNPASLEVSPNFSTIKEIHPGRNGSLIIHIQDAHANFSAQDNLAKTLRELMEKYGASLILSEGGWGDCTLTWLKAKADAKLLKREARSFLMAGKMQGEEYLNLTSELPMKIVGIEDEALYAQGLGAYQNLVQNREKAQDHLMKIRRAIEKLKNKLYPETLRAYERRAHLSDETRTDPVAFLTLAHEANFDLASYPALLKLDETLTKSSSDLTTLDLSGIFTEILQAEDVLYAQLLLTRDARLLRTVDRFVGLLESAHRIQMSSEQYAEFKRNEPDFKTEALEAFLNRTLAEAGYYEDVIPLSTVLEEGRKALDLFYETTRKRDLAFVRSAEESMKSSGQKLAFLIAGGYHTEHLKKLLAERGFGYAVLSPVVKAPTNTQKYERILLPKTDTQRAALLAVENGARLGELREKTQRLTATLIDKNPKRPILKTFFKRAIIALAVLLNVPAEGREALLASSASVETRHARQEMLSLPSDNRRRVFDQASKGALSEFISLQEGLHGHLESYFSAGDLVDRFREDFRGQLEGYHDWLSKKFNVDRQTLSDFAIDMDTAKKIDSRKYPSFLNSENLAGEGAMGVADRRVAHLERMVRDYWDGLIEKDLMPSMPDYLLNQTRGTQKQERSLVARQALFLLATYDPPAYHYLEKNNIQIYAAGLPGGTWSRTEGSKAKGMWGVPIISYSTRFGEAGDFGRPLQLAAFLAREAEFAQGYPADFSGLVDLVAERIQGLFFEMPLTLEERARRAQARFYRNFDIYMSHAEEVPKVPERALPHLEIDKSSTDGSRLATAEAKDKFSALIQKFNSRYKKYTPPFVFDHLNFGTNSIGGHEELNLLRDLQTIFTSSEILSERLPDVRADDIDAIASQLFELNLISDPDQIFLIQNAAYLATKKYSQDGENNLEGNHYKKIRRFYAIVERALFRAAEQVEPAVYDEGSVEVFHEGFSLKTKVRGLYFDSESGYQFLGEAGAKNQIFELDYLGPEKSLSPESAIRLFLLAAEKEAVFSLDLRVRLQEEATHFTPDRAAYEAFNELLKFEKNISFVLIEMRQMGFFGKLLPLFQSIENQYIELKLHDFSVAGHELFLLYVLDRYLRLNQGSAAPRRVDEESVPASPFDSDRADSGSFNEIRQIYNSAPWGAEDFLILRVAMLCHDLAKNGKNKTYLAPHPLESALVQTPEVLRLLGIDGTVAEDILWLVRHHHLLPAMAAYLFSKRSVDAEERGIHSVVLKMSNVHGLTERRMKLLLILSVADRCSARPKEWLGRDTFEFYPFIQMREIYNRVIGELRNSNELAARAEQERTNLVQAIKRNLVSGISSERIYKQVVENYKRSLGIESSAKFLGEIELSSPEFGLFFDEIAALKDTTFFVREEKQAVFYERLYKEIIFLSHLKGERIFRQKKGRTDIFAHVLNGSYRQNEEGYGEITVGVSQDKPGLFTKITGVLVAHGFSIVGAEALATQDGLSLDRIYGYFFEFSEKEEPNERMAKMIRDLGEVLNERKTLEAVFSEHPEVAFKRIRIGDFALATDLRFGRDVIVHGKTGHHLIIQSPDRLGLIHSVSRMLSEAVGANILESPLSTEYSGAKDEFVFALTDGLLLSDAAKVAILGHLKRLLERENYTNQDLTGAVKNLHLELEKLKGPEEVPEESGARLAEIYGVRLSEARTDMMGPADRRRLATMMKHSLDNVKYGFNLLLGNSKVIRLTPAWLQNRFATLRAAEIFGRIKTAQGYQSHKPVALVVVTSRVLEEKTIEPYRRIAARIQGLAGGVVKIQFAIISGDGSLSVYKDSSGVGEKAKGAGVVLIGALSEALLTAAQAGGYGVVPQDASAQVNGEYSPQVFLEGLLAVAIQRAPKLDGYVSQLWSLVRLAETRDLSSQDFEILKTVSSREVSNYLPLRVKLVPISWKQMLNLALSFGRTVDMAA